MAVKYTNNAKSTLASGINSSVTSATVADGSIFPALGAGEYFYITFDDGSNNEIAKVTARSGNTLTIVRAQDNTTARAFSTGDSAELRIIAAVLTEIQENIAAKSANQTVYSATAASNATAYNIGVDPGVEANASVFLDGVYQHHDTFSFSGSTLTFDAAPTNGTKIEVVVDNLINLQSSNLTVDTFTATSGQTAFTLSDAPGGEANVLAFIDGVFQNQAAFTLSSNTLTFDTGVVVGRSVTVYTINPVNIGTPSDSTVTSAKLTGNITLPGSLTVGAYDVAFDSPTFFVDHTNSRVGLGTSSPSVPVDIVGEAKISSHFTILDAGSLKVGTGADIVLSSDGTHGTIAAANGNLTLDASGDIILDADGDDWKFAEGGTTVMEIKHESHGVDFLLNTGNEDYRFKGSDDGSTITALHLDISEAGAATFNSDVTTGGKLTVSDGGNATVAAIRFNAGLGISSPSTDQLNFITDDTTRVIIDSSGVATFKKKVIVSAADGVTANDYVMAVQNLEATDGQSFGLSINAGSTSADIPLNVTDHDGSNALLRVYGNGATALVGSLSLTNTSHSVATIQAGTNASASLRLKNDNVDWDVNCQTNDHFAIYQHSLANSATNIQPFTITPAGLIGINKTNPSITMEVDSNSAGTGDDALSVANRGVTSVGHTTGLRFQYNSAIPSAIRTVLKNTSSGAGSLELQTSGDATAGNLSSRLKVHEQGHVSINSTQTATEKMGGLVVVGPIVTQGVHGNSQIGRNQSDGAGFASVSTSWNFMTSGSASGSFSGAVRFTVPSAAGQAGAGYGSCAGIIQLSGYNGPAMTGVFHFYQNQGIYSATVSELYNNGSFTITVGANGSHGWYVDVDIPSMTHPVAFVQMAHGGATTSASVWDLNECTFAWS